MAIVDIYPGVDVQNPVGWINLTPLPSLPSGVTRAYLLRGSLKRVRRNIALTDFDAERDTVQELNQGSGLGTLTYDEISLHTDTRGTGLLYPEWVSPLGVGGTWMAVATYDTESENIGVMATSRFSGDHGFALSFRSGGVQTLTRPDGIQRVTQSVSPIPEGPMMGFGVLDWDNEEYSAYVPHTDEMATESWSSWDPTPEAGVEIGTSSSDFDDPHDNRKFFVMEWDRPLSQSEMQQAYQALKPWLSRLGVDIA